MDTIPANTSTTEVITPNGSRTSTIDTLGDRDWFRTTLTSGYTYEITLEGTGTATELGRVEYFVYNSAGTLLYNEADADFNGFELGTFTASAGGTYYIAATGYNDGYTGDYTLSLGNDDVRNSVATTKTIAPGGTVSGTIDAFGDRDWFRVSLDGDFSYRVTMQGTGTATELSRPEYFVRDSAGNLLQNITDSGFNGFLGFNFKPTADGIYYISATGYNDGYKGDYTLSLGTDDFRDTSATLSDIAPGGSVTGSIDGFLDRDWHRISLEADFSYRIRMEGTGTSTELNRPEYFVRDSAGNLLQNIADSGFNGFIATNFKPTADGVYYISATGYNDGHQGDYTLSVGTDDYRASPDTQGTIAPGGSVTASIDGFLDRDWFEISLEADFSYNIRMEGTGTTTELNRVEYFVRNAAGTVVQNIADTDGNGIQSSIFTPTTAGTYYIEATGYNDGHAGDYTLSVGTDEARNTVSTEQEIAVGQSITGAIDGFGDRDWYGTMLQSGTAYTITLEGDGSASELGRVEFFIYDLNGNQVANIADTDGNGIESTIFTPNATGNYYISATGYNDGHTGDYILSVAGDDPVTTGSNQDDALFGNSADEVFNGLAGDDTIFAGGGNDTVYGGADDDILVGADGNDILYGESGTDSLFGGDGNDRLNGGTGPDTLNGGAGIDFAEYLNSASGLRVDLQFVSLNTGEAAGDTFTSIENLRGTTLNDDLRGDANDNRIDGFAGNDVISGRAGDDDLRGNAGDDVLVGGTGADALDGAAGTDRAQYADSGAGLRVDLQFAQTNTGIAAGDTFVSVENLTGSNFDDDLRGDGAGNRIDGRTGNDVVFGRDGDDTLIGGTGDDILYGGLGGDELFGGAGIDRAQYNDASSGVTADLQNSALNSGAFAAGDTYSQIENLLGTGFTDNLRGNGGDNVLTGGNARDFLTGRNGNDTLLGGNGDDVLTGGVGADIHNGGAGIDQASYIEGISGVTADLQFAQFNSGIAAGDTYINVENLRGAQAADDMRGDSGANKLEGFGGNDMLTGRGGDDELRGGTGNDILRGGAGNDLLVGSSGNDAFRFVSTSDGVDTILDFILDQDVIQLDDAGFTSLSAGSLSATNFRVGGAAADADDYVIYNATNGRLYYDGDGSGAAAQIQIAVLSNTAAIDQDDFLIL